MYLTSASPRLVRFLNSTIPWEPKIRTIWGPPVFSLGEAQTPVALSTQSVRKAPKNPAKRDFLVPYIAMHLSFKLFHLFR